MKLQVAPHGLHFPHFDLYLERSNLKNGKSTLTHVAQTSTVRTSIENEGKKTIDYHWVGWYILKWPQPVHYKVSHDIYISSCFLSC